MNGSEYRRHGSLRQMKKAFRPIINSTMIVTSLLMNSIVLGDDEIVHIVQKGETVSGILFNKNIGPIYGRKGALRAIFQLNPHLKSREDGKVYPGDVVLIKHRSVQISFVSKVESPGKDCLQKVSFQEQVHFTKEDVGEKVKENPSRTIASEDSFEQNAYWSFVPSVYWQTLDAVHENIYRRSELHSYSTNNYAFSLLFGRHLSANLDFYTRASLNLSNFQMGEGEQVVSKKYTTSSFYVGAELYKKYQFELGMEEKMYLVSSNYATADIKKLKVPKFSVGYEADLYQYNKAVFLAGFNAKGYLPKKSSSIKAKTGYGAGAELKMQYSKQEISIGIDQDFLKARGNSTDSQSLFLKFTWDMQ